jgi:hypothetical protein
MTKWSLLLVMVACGDTPVPDPLGIDAPSLLGDYSCHETPWPEAAPDPVVIEGRVQTPANTGLGGATVEVRLVGDDSILGQAATKNSITGFGNYTLSASTGGVAPTIYRTTIADGYLDSYAYDPFAAFDSYSITNTMVTAADTDFQYQLAGVPRVTGQGTVWIDVFDCSDPGGAGQRVRGATIDSPPSGKVVYLSEECGVDPTLTATQGCGAIVFGANPGLTDYTVHAAAVTYRPWPIDVRRDAFTTTVRRP